MTAGRIHMVAFPVIALLAGCGTALAATALAIQSAAGSMTYQAAGAVACFAVVGLGVIAGLGRDASRVRFGAANTVTLLRAMMASLLAGLTFSPLAGPGPAWAVVVVAVAALVLDGVDGFLARRYGQTSRFGARFDMEVDALLLLVLSLLVAQAGKAGPWVLGIGLARPAFAAAGRACPWLRADLPDSRRRKVVCVIQGIALAVALAPVVPPAAASSVAAAALTLLLLSFAGDIRWLYRQRRSRGQPKEGASSWPTASAGSSHSPSPSSG